MKKTLLELGLNFAASPKGVPRMNIIAGVEAALHRSKHCKDIRDEITARVCVAVENANKPQSNLSISQHKALKLT